MSNSGKLFDAKDIYKLRRNNEGGSKIGLFMGGATPSDTAGIDKITFNGGNATDFGDLTTARNQAVGGGSDTRGVAMGGNPSYQNVIDYVQFNTTGNAADFGDLTQGKNGAQGGSNQIRAVESGGYTTGASATNVIDFITIASIGNATDFGDATTTNKYTGAGAASPTRCLFAGGDQAPSPYLVNIIDFIEFATTGNATDFGDLTGTRSNVCGSSSNTIALFAGGQTPTRISTIDKVTMATTGNATDFGDLLAATNGQGDQGVSDNIRGVFAGGYAPSIQNVIQSISFTTSGTATDFGDLSVAKGNGTGASNCGGGLVPGESQLSSVTYMPGSGRGLIQKVGTPFNANVSYIHIPTLSNSVDFGDMTQSRNYAAGASSVTRGIAGGGSNPSVVSTIDYTEMASRGNYADFGDLSVSRSRPAGNVGSTTRALFSGGDTPTKQDVIDYITMASVGNATDFGNLTVARTDAAGGLSSSTRGVVGGGATPSSTESNIIDYVTIASTGNSTDFGDLSTVKTYLNGVSSSTRGVFSSGLSTPSSPYGGAVIDYITISSTGNATDFGDPTQNRYGPAGMSNSTRGVFAGGRLAPNNYDVIDYITIASTGNAADFGDLSNTGECLTAASDNHGGLQA